MSDADVRCPRCKRYMPMSTCDVCTIDDAIDNVLATERYLAPRTHSENVGLVIRELKGRCNPQQVEARMFERVTRKK